MIPLVSSTLTLIGSRQVELTVSCSKIISVYMRQQVFAFSDILFIMTDRYDRYNEIHLIFN